MTDISTYRAQIGLFNLRYKRLKSKPSKISFFKYNVFSFIFIFLILGAQTCNNFSKVKQLSCNKCNHMIHGNISANGTYKFITWNKGNSLFSNKIDDIKYILDEFSPNIFLSVRPILRYITT